MLDAISFVLGIQPSQLRSHQLRDLIYRGRVENAGLLGIAGVDTDDFEKQPYPPSESDPTSAYVCAVYEKDNGECVKLRRTINNNGSSDYRIDEKIVTALQYSLALKAENILVKAKNFLVFQGDIENVAAQSPKDLARMVETISGSAEYAAEYDLLKEDFERTRDVAAEVFSRKRNLNSESKQYKEQMREREIFEAKLNEKYTVVKKLHLYRIFHNQKRHFQLLADARSLTEQLDAANARLAAIEESYSSCSAKASKASLDAKQIETQITDVKLKLEATRRSMIPVGTGKKSLQSRIELNNAKLEDLNRDMHDQQQFALKLAERLAQAESQLVEMELQTEQAFKKAQIPLEGLEEYRKLRGQFLASSGAQMEEKLTLLEIERDELMSSARNLEHQIENSSLRTTTLESSVRTAYKPKLVAATAALEEQLALYAAKITLKGTMVKKNQDLELKEAQLAAELRQIMAKLDEISLEQKETKKQKKLKENVAMLKNVLKEGAIKGVFHELVRSTLQKYDLALQTALGGNLDALVVESTAVACQCVDILKERRAGTATFIPVDSVLTDAVNLNLLRTLSDSACPAVDVAKFDDATIERAVMFALGDTLIVDTVDDARSLKWGQSVSNKMVTLDGAVLHRSGLMTGGEHIQKTSASLSWSRQDLARMSSERDEVVGQLAAIQADKNSAIEINNLSEEIVALDETVQQLRSKIGSLERDLHEREQEIEFYRQQTQNLETMHRGKIAQAAALELQMASIRSEMQSEQNTIYGDFCRTYGLDNINEYEAAIGPGLRARARERAEMQRAVASFKSQVRLHNENCAETQGRIERLLEAVTKLEENLLDVMCQWEDLEQKYSDLERRLSDLDESRKEAMQNHTRLMNVAKTVETDLSDVRADLRDLSKDVVASEEALLKVDTQRLNLLKNCKIENVDLPLENGFLDDISLEGGGDVSSAAYSVYVEYSLLEVPLQERYLAKTEAELQLRAEEIDRELQQLTPNAKAMDRLREVDDKLKNFDREFTKARQEEKQASIKFADVKQLRTERFMAAFSHIADHIDAVYKELTSGTATAGTTSIRGGSAYLTLEDEDEPYAGGIRYHAMPPQKRFRDMDLLSGGEKTMAALALLFAVHLFRPAPFFVLDEVDAALDNINVARLASYMKRHAGAGHQFIVISLKSSLFENLDSLVGIYREQRENASKTVTLDLRHYQTTSVEVEKRTEAIGYS